jgi:carbon-monoxide dehydrogenase medium subunit
MKPPPFVYTAPGTIDEAVEIKAANGDEAAVLAGGQSLIPLMSLRLATPSVLIDLNGVEELSYFSDEDGRLMIGAMARHRDVEDARQVLERLPILADAVPMIGHRAIRNRGTVAGSIAHADPAAEWPGIALALDGTIQAVSVRGERTITAADFFVGPFMNTLEPDEIVREVRFNIPGGAGSAFVEHSRRSGDFALAAAGAIVELTADDVVSSARIVLVGTGGTPFRASDGESAIEGRTLTDENVEAVGHACQSAVDPPSSVHGSGAYRRHLIGVLVGRALRLAGERARAA